METSHCAAGLHCAERTATSVFEGTCRPMRVGAACAGNWECAFPYVCDGAGPMSRGTCQLGKPVGASCSTYLADVNENPYSNCAPLPTCLRGICRRC